MIEAQPLPESQPTAGSRRHRASTAVEISSEPAAGEDQASHERALVLSAAEARYHREERLDVVQTRAWGVVAVLVGLVGAGAALLVVTTDTVKAVVPIAAAVAGVVGGVAAALAPQGTLRRWLVPGARAGNATGPPSLTRITDTLEAQRRDARRSAILAWRDE